MFDVGLIITGVGMLGVFIFLILMVFAMDIMSKIIQKLLPEKEVVQPAKKRSSTDLEIAIAVAAIQNISNRESR